MSDKVVFLAHSNEQLKIEKSGTEYISCANCRNKTFALTYQEGEQFPALTCAACRQRLGSVGFVPGNCEGEG